MPEMQNIESKSFGTYEEYCKCGYLEKKESFVIKPGSGTRSRGVSLLKTVADKRNVPYEISRSFTFDNVKLFLSKIRTGKPFTPMSNNRKKFVVQTFVSGLEGDYRVLVYGKKYYVVFRKNRTNDFTASGSGKLDFNIVPPAGLLEFSKVIYQKFDTPFVSLDIGHKNGNFYLFEFQCLNLGQYTLEKSEFCYLEYEDGTWKKVKELPDLEREIAETVSIFIKEKTCVE